jgi:hypothetical protein
MILSILIVLASLLYVSIDQKNKNLSEMRTSYASVMPVVRQIMVVDMANRGIFTPELVMAGQLPILAIHQGNDPYDYTKDLFTFLDSVGRLTNFDRVNDDRIDQNDALFSQLELVYLNGNKVARIVPVAEAGVRQVYLDRKHMNPEPLYPNGPLGYWNVANSVILANGSKRNMRVVPMNASDLPIPVTYGKNKEFEYQVA